MILGFLSADQGESTADHQVVVFGSFVTIAATMRWLRQADKG